MTGTGERQLKLVSNPALWETFFSLKTIGELRQFRSALDHSVPEQAALAYYISTWPFDSALNNAPFAPGSSLSPDRTAVMYGNAPVIFEGTNHWCMKPYLPTEALHSKLAGLEHLVGSIRRSNLNAKITLVLVPEKDHVISRFILGENRFELMEEALATLGDRMAALDVKLIFDEPFRDLSGHMEIQDFHYGDSHLASRNYLKIKNFILQALGSESIAERQYIEFTEQLVFGDLATKFTDGRSAREIDLRPDVANSQVVQVGGNETFASPLGSTWQEFRNNSPLIDETICLLGDSHCSIYEQRRLTYILANIYSRTYFAWNPCGIREKPGVLDFDNVVLESSSRFVV